MKKIINEEVTIRGNKGIPGEGNNGENERSYLSDVELRARARLGVPREEDPRLSPPHQTIELFREMNKLMRQSMDFIIGNEKRFEDLAKRIILSEYRSILDNVDLDIKIVKPQEVKSFIEAETDDESSPTSSQKDQISKPSYRILDDPEIKKEVDKRKILNNITQGEAKNTKRILAMPEVRDGIISILGNERGMQAHRVWKRITEIADKLDWLIPIDIKSDMIEKFPEGMAGACSVKWPDRELDEESKDLSIKVLKNLEGGDIDDDDADLQELLSTGNPVIRARGVDFPMLLHETVKGIYELIISSGIPEDRRTAELVIMNTSSFADEAEEFRYGPEIAADIRDFINKSKKEIDKYPNIRERFCGRLSIMPADEFLLLVKNILSDSPSARAKVDQILQDIINELDEYHKSLVEFELDNMGDNETYGEPKKVDYSKMSQRDIRSLIDDALDSGDFDRVKFLSQYLKEGRSNI